MVALRVVAATTLPARRAGASICPAPTLRPAARLLGVLEVGERGILEFVVRVIDQHVGHFHGREHDLAEPASGSPPRPPEDACHEEGEGCEEGERCACGGGREEERWCVLTKDPNEATERALDRRRPDRALQVVEIVLVRREVLARVGSDAVFVRLVRLPTRQVRASSGAAKVRGGWAGGLRGRYLIGQEVVPGRKGVGLQPVAEAGGRPRLLVALAARGRD